MIDRARHRAYANLWRAKTVAIDLASRAIVERWENGCKGSRGLALDAARGFFSSPAPKASRSPSTSPTTARALPALTPPYGVDVIAFSPGLSHLYFPGARSDTLSILAVSPPNVPPLPPRTSPTPPRPLRTTDDATRIFVRDPAHGRLLLIRDSYPKSR